MPPKKGSHQKYSSAVETFLVTIEEFLTPLDAVWIHMAKDIAKDLDVNGTNGTMLSQFSKVILRLESRRPVEPKPDKELPPVERDQLDIFMEQNGL
jgi:hypothetical protein